MRKNFEQSADSKEAGYKTACLGRGLVLGLVAMVGAGLGCSSSQDLDIEIPRVKVSLKSEMDFEGTRDQRPVTARLQPGLTQPAVSSASGKPAGAGRDKQNVSLRETFAKEKSYLVLNRYPSVPPPLVQKQGKIRETVQIRDKPLILAGKGFGAAEFFSRADMESHFSFSHRLERPLPPQSPAEAPDNLDLTEENIPGRKFLIFHPRVAAFQLVSGNSAETFPGPVDNGLPWSLEKIPETILSLHRDGRSSIGLAPGEKSMDLLRGNEALNKHTYTHW